MDSEESFSVARQQLERLTVWAASYDPNGAVHLTCCNSLCAHMAAARDAGALAAIAQQPETVTAHVVAGLYVSLDCMVKHAMETGLLNDKAGVSVYPTGL